MKLAEFSITNQCNFSCDYCKSEASFVQDRFKKGWGFAGPIVDFHDWIEFSKRELSGWIIQVTGGEPTIVQGFATFVTELLKTNEVIINTNGTNLHNVLPDIVGKPKLRISYHPEFRKGDFGALIRDALRYVPKENILVNYVIHPRHIGSGKCFDYMGELQEIGIPFEVSPFEGSYIGEYYRLFHEIYDGLKSVSQKMASEFDLLVVAPTGSIFDCHGSRAPLGNIHTSYNLNPCSKRCRMPNGDSLCPMFDNVAKLFG